MFCITVVMDLWTRFLLSFGSWFRDNMCVCVVWSIEDFLGAMIFYAFSEFYGSGQAHRPRVAAAAELPQRCRVGFLFQVFFFRDFFFQVAKV